MGKYVELDEYRTRLNNICRSGYTQQVIDVFIDWFLSIAESIAIEEIPPVVHAHWEILPPCFEEICMCSNCQTMFKEALQFSEERCPNCKAIMDEKVKR